MHWIVREGARRMLAEALQAEVDAPSETKKYNRALRDLVAGGKARPSFIVSHELPLDRAPEAYRNVDSRENGWTKVVLHP